MRVETFKKRYDTTVVDKKRQEIKQATADEIIYYY